jgi:hypothetical protein
MAGIDGKVFTDAGTHPLILLREYLGFYGPSALDWEPFVVKRSLDEQLRENISRISLLKLLAAITVANHDNFWSSWEAFHTISQALAGKIPSVSHIDNQSISDLLLSVDSALAIRKDLGSASDLPDFSEEVCRYMAAQLHESGIWYVPAPLDFLNPLVSGETQVCGLCKNEETPKEDGLCSYCTDRYNTESLLKLEPDEELRKTFDGSKVKIVVKFPTEGVRAALRRAQTAGGSVLKETADDICAAKILEGLRDLDSYRAQITAEKVGGIPNAPKILATHSNINQDDRIGAPESQGEAPVSTFRKYINPVSVGGSALVAGALLRKPAAARKFLTTAKELVTKPVASIGRSMSSGANYVGSGADDFSRGAAQSKRVELMSESLRNLNDELQGQIAKGAPLAGRVDQFAALSGGERGLGTLSDKLRRSGFASAGREKFQNVAVDRDAADRLNKLLAEMDTASSAGKQVDYNQIRAAYDQFGNIARQQAAAGKATRSKGFGYYLPGERAGEVASPVVTGLGTGYFDDTDPQTGQQRSTAERLARGVVAGGISAGTGALFAGRNLGLSKANLFTGTGRSALSAKLLVPSVSGAVIGSTIEDVGADAAGAGVRTIDTAFGQKKDSSS